MVSTRLREDSWVVIEWKEGVVELYGYTFTRVLGMHFGSCGRWSYASLDFTSSIASPYRLWRLFSPLSA